MYVCMCRANSRRTLFGDNSRIHRQYISVICDENIRKIYFLAKIDRVNLTTLRHEILYFKLNLPLSRSIKLCIYNIVHFSKAFFGQQNQHVAKLLAPKATLVAFTYTSSTRLRPRSRSRIHVSVQETKKRGGSHTRPRRGSMTCGNAGTPAKAIVLNRVRQSRKTLRRCRTQKRTFDNGNYEKD